MHPDLKGKVVLVTGASTGIGAAAALAFAREGCKLVIHYNASADAARAVAGEAKRLGAEAILSGGDVMQEADVKKIVAEALSAYGRIDVLVNNAGGMLGRIKIEDYTVEHINRVLSDAGGNIYITTGNGAYDGTKNFSESVLKLSPTGGLLDWFVPFNRGVFDANDIDMGSAGAMVLPVGMMKLVVLVRSSVRR